MSVPRGIHFENVSRFFRENVPGGNCELSFEQISGGRSNITYLVRGGGAEWVLRRPPLGHVLPTAHDMVREYRVLTGLRDTNVPVPQTYALCEDSDVNDMPFYVMEYCPGIVLADDIPAGYAESDDERRNISLNLVETLTRLHAVDYLEVGLGDFGHPKGYIERQVRRWAQQWERSKTDELAEIEDLIARLRAALPESPPPTIVHGDYRLGNMALDPDDPSRIVAIFDWEMATLGDPLADLGYTLIYWYEEEDIRPGSLPTVTARPGFLKRTDLIEEYAKRSGRDVSTIDFYQVLALYKLAIISEGIYARFLQGKTLGKDFEGMKRSADATAQRGIDIANRSSDRRLRATAF